MKYVKYIGGSRIKMGRQRLGHGDVALVPDADAPALVARKREWKPSTQQEYDKMIQARVDAGKPKTKKKPPAPPA